MLKISTVLSLSVLLLKNIFAQPLSSSVVVSSPSQRDNNDELLRTTTAPSIINYDDPQFYTKLLCIALLVLLGGVFAGVSLCCNLFVLHI